MTRFDADADEVCRNIKAYRIARVDPALLATCACLNGMPQSACKVCNDPPVSCIGCIRRRMNDGGMPRSQCPICWQAPNAACPAR